MNDQKPNQRRSTPASLGELCGLLAVGTGLFVFFELAFEMMEGQFGLAFLGIGRRMDFGSVLAAVLAILFTRIIAAVLGIRERR